MANLLSLKAEGEWQTARRMRSAASLVVAAASSRGPTSRPRAGAARLLEVRLGARCASASVAHPDFCGPMCKLSGGHEAKNRTID
jgi:hypothetical protein